MAISSIAGFESHDTFRHTLRFLNPKDLFLIEQVCKSWEKAVIDLRVLEDHLEAENIPGIDGRRPNYRAYVVLKGMFERGVGVEAIRKYYGEPVFGKMPHVSSEKYDLMFQPDSEMSAKMMFETYEAVFTPLAIKRTFGKDLVATVDEEGRLKITKSTDSNSTEYELEIPFSFPNLVELSKYPLAGQKNGPVFRIYTVEILDQFKHQATKVGIYFMRSNILENSRLKTSTQQEAQAKSINQEIAPLNVRALSHSKKILESKQCPDGQTPHLTYSRAPDCIQIDEDSYHVVLGGFAPGAGVGVHSRNGDANGARGVAPGVPAEVRPLVLG